LPPLPIWGKDCFAYSSQAPKGVLKGVVIAPFQKILKKYKKKLGTIFWKVVKCVLLHPLGKPTNGFQNH
jgi:hypothetical protein